MDEMIYLPIVIEATKFMFNEISKWVDHVRKHTNKEPDANTDSQQGKSFGFTSEEFYELETDDLRSIINVDAAETNAYVIDGLVEQLKIHYKNLIDLERIEAEYGALTPLYVKRGIEHESNSIIEKAERLRSLLDTVYGENISQ